MKTIKTLGISIAIWILGVSAFTLIYELPITENRYVQANIGLALVVPILVWAGAWLYYRKGSSTHGLKLGLAMLLVSASLDALITVPLLILPSGGSYASFFGSMDFWLIGLEFITVSALFWYFKVFKPTHSITQ
ncbi:DUF5367 family protein [Flagellimonas algicola]|uniref:Uncharacterized protein n=1 Tax=Flagellimonas algicola TaxID=2583815 RepID=A0ABY2WLK9_9FLAO|nr:DUF5367 family protein [Allomuricauda algicola]TMU55720.1 hypothetical protein FGG15_16280 [Allomuricauda algicola]